MILTISERRAALPDGARAQVEPKLKKLDRFFHSDAEVSAKFAALKEQKICEITVRHANLYFRAEEKASDFLSALDAAVDSIIRQIRKNKTRLEKRLREGAFERAISGVEPAPVDEDEIAIYRSKRFYLLPMTAEEAVLQMNLLDHKFFIYIDAETDELNVVYKRVDGAYGHIECLR